MSKLGGIRIDEICVGNWGSHIMAGPHSLVRQDSSKACAGDVSQQFFSASVNAQTALLALSMSIIAIQVCD